jgi:broad specificity phosphatase PhoE
VEASILQVTELIREHSFGVREGLPKGTSEIDARAAVAERLGIPETEVVDMAETSDDVLTRQKKFIQILRVHANQIAKSKISGYSSSDKPITLNALCVSHGAFILSFLSNIVGIRSSKIKNCSISIVTFDLPSFLDVDSEMHISSNSDFINSVSHLSRENASLKFSWTS